MNEYEFCGRFTPSLKGCIGLPLLSGQPQARNQEWKRTELQEPEQYAKFFLFFLKVIYGLHTGQKYGKGFSCDIS